MTLRYGLDLLAGRIADGLDTFRLGYEFVRDQIGMHRENLRRHGGGHDDKVVVVKAAQTA